MLKTLEIQNVALIDNISLDFCDKLNVLSGETGAGKSIIVDSLNFVIGGKLNKSLIRQGCDFMKVVACFSVPFPQEVVEILKDFDIDFDDEILVSRKLSIDGKSDLRVNGKLFPTTNFKKLCVYLVDIHSQHEHQKLAKEKFHLEIIDSFIKDKTIFVDYFKAYEQLRSINLEINKLNGSTQNQERMLDLLDYQIKEIELANLRIGEDEELEQKKIVMQNYEKIYDGLNNAFNEIENSPSVVDSLKHASNYLSSIQKYDEQLSSLIERLDSIKYEIMDISSSIKDKRDDCNFNEYDYEEIDNRLDKIKQLKKKYGPTLEDVLKFLDNSKNEYSQILNSKDLLIHKLKEKENALSNVYDLAVKISEVRKTTAKVLESKINNELVDLGMKNARFKVLFNNLPSINNFEDFLNSTGIDEVKFLFSANLGQDLKPLSEIISGGEASRFMLALKTILADVDNVSLMVFDEIDTDISGQMGYKVACKLAQISKTHQVISISHLPQICAMADNNIMVKKFAKDGNTIVSVTSLDNVNALKEISRLSGGEESSENSLKHARELKEKCDNFKKTLKY